MNTCTRYASLIAPEPAPTSRNRWREIAQCCERIGYDSPVGSTARWVWVALALGAYSLAKYPPRVGS